MNIWDITFSNGTRRGTAIVSARNANSAGIVLQSMGRLNSNRYNIQSILEIGCNDSPIELIISETFETQSVININELTKDLINQLGLRINKGTQTLVVDRFGSRESTLRHKNGFTYFRTVSLPSENGKFNKLSGEITGYNSFKPYHLYKYNRSNDTYTDFGVPKQFRYIETSKERLTMDWSKFKDNYDKLYQPVVVHKENFSHPKYGLFVLAKSSSNLLKKREGYRKFRYRYKLVAFLMDTEEAKQYEGWVNSRIRENPDTEFKETYNYVIPVPNLYTRPIDMKLLKMVTLDIRKKRAFSDRYKPVRIQNTDRFDSYRFCIGLRKRYRASESHPRMKNSYGFHRRWHLKGEPIVSKSFFMETPINTRDKQ